jgi:hypothetical protein
LEVRSPLRELLKFIWDAFIFPKSVPDKDHLKNRDRGDGSYLKRNGTFDKNGNWVADIIVIDEVQYTGSDDLAKNYQNQLDDPFINSEYDDGVDW